MKKQIIAFFAVLGIILISNEIYSQLIKTQLRLSVKNNLGKEEEGVRVRLYATEEDYKAEKNMVQEHYTNRKGIVVFKDLQPIKYYINAVKDNKTNYGNGEVSEPLKEKQINQMLVIINE